MSFTRLFAIALCVFAVTYVYLGWSLASPSIAGWIVIAVPFLTILALPLTVWGGDRRENVRLKDMIAHAAYAAMGLLTYLTVFTLIRDAVWLASDVRWPSYFVIAATVFALAAGAIVALLGPAVKRVDLKYENLPPALDGFRIVQITDLHVGGFITPGYVERVVAKANAEKPDVVALTGDIGDGDSRRSRPGIDPLSRLEPRGRVYYVPGNHEYYWNIEEWLAVFREIGTKPLLNSGEIIAHKEASVLIAGVPDKMSGQLKAGEPPDVVKAYRGGETAQFRILLSHRPSTARRAAESGFDLQVSGHTHGGQFFPWTLVVRAVHEFHEGLSRVGRMWIYVSHGTGTWGPPLRLGTVPEVTSLVLRRG